MNFKEFYLTESKKYILMKVINVIDKKTKKILWRSKYSTRNMIIAKQYIRQSEELDPKLKLTHKITKEKIRK